MDDVVSRLESLDNIQLRAELLKHGEKVGPVTPTTRKIFLSRLAKKVFLAEHPEAADSSSADSQSAEVRKDGEDGMAASVPATPTGRKSALDKSGEKEEHSTYYVVILAECLSTPPNTNVGPELRVFTEKLEALAFMKKNTGSRLKVFHSSSDVKRFMFKSSQNADEPSKLGSKTKSEEPSNNNLASEAEKSAFKGPKTQELVQFRKLIEKGDLDAVKTTMWGNPRYLVSSADTPVILHEGMRHNAMHIAAKSNQATIATLVVQTLLDPEFTKLLYSASQDTQQSRYQRIVYLVDLYLNSPDKGSGETALHIACKMGHTAMVRCVVMFSATDTERVNKYNEKPEDIICSRYKGENSAVIKEEIRELLKGLCLVPLLRSHDNVTLPVVGEPCSPDSKLKLQAPPTTPSLTQNPSSPRLTLSAYAGPMSPSKAQDFQKQWTNPRCRRNFAEDKEITTARRADPDKGYERVGRKLARELKVPWTEYWQFLDAFADFSTPEGLQKLEKHLQKQLSLLSFHNAMEVTSSVDDDDTLSEASSDESGDCSQDENFYSCDEGSNDEKSVVIINSSGDKHCSSEETEDDVFEDSLDSFFDTQSHVFGQRLQLKKSNNNEAHQKDKNKLKGSEEATRGSKTPRKSEDLNSSLWSYRDVGGSGELEPSKQIEISLSSDTTHSFEAPDYCSGTRDDVEKIHKEKTACTQGGETEISSTKNPIEGSEASFNTILTELADDLEVKLIFSPDGKVVLSPKGRSAPDIGLCLGRRIYSKSLRSMRRGECPLDVVIRSRKGTKHFIGDVLIHCSLSEAGNNEEFSDDSSDHFSNNVNHQHVMTGVKMLVKSAAVFKHVSCIARPVTVTVGVLEQDAQDVKKCCGCVNARIVCSKRRKCQQIMPYVYGSKPCKTDLDVMRAMCECNVDPAIFPAVHAWLSVVTATQQEGRASWPSPAKLRHQHHLSQLHNQSLPGSPQPVSPLVQGGVVTSTPKSRSSLAGVCCNRNLSPERPALIKTPRTWLFKSPT